MDWKLFFSAFAGALGGTATGLALIGVLGKTLVEHWFSRRLKEYELDLKVKADRSLAKNNYLFPKKVEAAEQVLSTCRNMNRMLMAYLKDSASCQKKAWKDGTNHFEQLSIEAQTCVADTEHLFAINRNLLTDDFPIATDELLKEAKTISHLAIHYKSHPIWYYGRALRIKIERIEGVYKKLIADET